VRHSASGISGAFVFDLIAREVIMRHVAHD